VKLIYPANARIPSEKAHPYQIVQMCEAFAAAGADVTLIYPARRNPPDLDTGDIWAHYGVERTFRAERIPVVDLYPLAWRLPGRLGRAVDRLAAILIHVLFNGALMLRLARERDAVIYGRHPIGLALYCFLWPRRARRVFYEVHVAPTTPTGTRLRRWLMRRVGGVVTITEHLHERHIALGAAPERVITAHDGFRAARFAIKGDRAEWRRRLGWPQEAFIVGYMGRFISGLQSMDKGIGTLVEAVIELAAGGGDRPLRLALVGGPDAVVEQVRARLDGAGLPPDFLLYPGMVPPVDVPGYLRAFDVCTIPLPWSEFFAYDTSPLKLFEYMAAGRPIVASDLPSTAEILRNGENGLLVPPGDPHALADALRRLRDDPALGERLAAQAARDVQAYTWEARARRILDFIRAKAGGTP